MGHPSPSLGILAPGLNAAYRPPTVHRGLKKGQQTSRHEKGIHHATIRRSCGLCMSEGHPLLSISSSEAHLVDQLRHNSEIEAFHPQTGFAEKFGCCWSWLTCNLMCLQTSCVRFNSCSLARRQRTGELLIGCELKYCICIMRKNRENHDQYLNPTARRHWSSFLGGKADSWNEIGFSAAWAHALQ